jgi:molybdopterin-containing oxidoreductase family membrane subunit
MADDSSIKTAGTAGFSGWRDIIEKVWQGSRAYKAALIISIVFVFLSLVAGFHAKYVGAMHVFGVSREVPWGILISTYVFFVVTSTGLCLVSSIGHVFGVKDFIPLAKRSVYLAVVTIISGFYIMFFETENPFRLMIYNVISPNFTSNIWWMGTLYGAYMFFMAIEFYLLMTRKFRSAAMVGFLGVVSGIAAHSNLGAVFGMIHGREFWYGSFMPIYFIASAMMSGAAAVILFTWLSSKVSREDMDAAIKRDLEVTATVGMLFIAIIIFFTFWKFVSGYVAGESEQAALNALISGPYAFNFWGLEIFCGMLLPLFLFIKSKRKNINLIVWASALMILGIFFMRYDLVVVGQIVPVYFDLGVTDAPGLLSYRPSLHEILIVLGAIAITVIGFLVGERLFDGHKTEIH